MSIYSFHLIPYTEQIELRRKEAIGRLLLSYNGERLLVIGLVVEFLEAKSGRILTI